MTAQNKIFSITKKKVVSKNINGCNVTLIFSERRNEKVEKAILAILMESYENRLELNFLQNKNQENFC